eukprot:1311555-Prymnesium_polylepis.2
MLFGSQPTRSAGWEVTVPPACARVCTFPPMLFQSWARLALASGARSRVASAHGCSPHRAP